MSFTQDDLTFLTEARDTVASKMFGLEKVTTALIIALMARSHVLLEGNPGLGKTALVREIGSALGLGKKAVGRIQFTPDLMPSDITGTERPMPSEDGQGTRLKFQKGPVFCSLLIADEINRATPKTQAAMLEAMAEQQVTVLGTTYPLADWKAVPVDGRPDRWVRPPFLVMATQNPIDQDGVFPLPEAQSDRFMFKVRMPFPSAATLSLIMDKEAEVMKKKAPSVDDEAQGIGDASLIRLHACANAIRETHTPDSLRRHILNMVMASCRKWDQIEGISPPRMKALKEWVKAEVDYELGPRAATALRFSSIGWAALPSSGVRRADEVGANARQGLAATVLPVLRHRMKFRHSEGIDAMDGLANEADATDDSVARFAVLCAPDDDEALFGQDLLAERAALL